MNPTKLQKLRHQAFERQNCRCYYCELPIWEVDPEQFTRSHDLRPRHAMLLRCTAEHLLAQQDGGGETAQNIAAACLWCNRMRHFKRQYKAPDPIAYKSRVSKLIAKGVWHPAVGMKFRVAVQQAPGISLLPCRHL